MMSLGWSWPILQEGKIWSLLLLDAYTVDFWEIIEACEVEVGTYSQISDQMMIYDNPMSREYIDRCPRLLRFNIFNFYS